MTNALTIRPARPEDRAAWQPLWDGYNAYYGREGATALAPEQSLLTWQRFHDDSEPMHALVAQRGEELVGLVHFLYHRSTLMAQPVCYLQDLFTAPAARGQGVGRALIAAVYEQVRAAGGKRVYWHTQNSNATARALYDQVASDPGFMVYQHFL